MQNFAVYFYLKKNHSNILSPIVLTKWPLSVCHPHHNNWKGDLGGTYYLRESACQLQMTRARPIIWSSTFVSSNCNTVLKYVIYCITRIIHQMHTKYFIWNKGAACTVAEILRGQNHFFVHYFADSKHCFYAPMNKANVGA